MDSTAIFDDRARIYARYRPSYLESAIAKLAEGIAAILDRLPDLPQLIAADIGAGTGIASRQLAEQGIKVIAVEPNEAMIQQHESHPLVEFKLGTAENTTLADNVVDLITSFQAFHWFDPLPTLKEFHRILKPSGRLALIWSNWDESDTVTQEFCQFVQMISQTPDRHQNWESKTGIPPANSYFSSFDRLQFSYVESRNLPYLIGLVESQGFISLSGEKHEQLVENLKELHQKWAGDRHEVSLVYRTEVYISQSDSLS